MKMNFAAIFFSPKVVHKESSRFIPSWSTLTLFPCSPKGVHKWPAYAYTHSPWPEAVWSAVKQTALTSGRGGDGELRVIVKLLRVAVQFSPEKVLAKVMCYLVQCYKPLYYLNNMVE